MSRTTTSSHIVFALALLMTLSGCTGGVIGLAPPLESASEAGSLTLSRDFTLVGLGMPMQVSLDGRPLLKLAPKRSFVVPVNPGTHLVKYTIGLNECTYSVPVRPRQQIQLRLVANCEVRETRPPIAQTNP